MSNTYGVARRRPMLLSIITILMIISGVLSVLAGILTFVIRNDREWVVEVGETNFTRTSIAVAAIISGVISILFAMALRRGSRIARGLVGIYEVLHIVAAIYAIVKLDHRTYLSGAIVSIVLALIILWYLYATQKSREFFGP